MPKDATKISVSRPLSLLSGGESGDETWHKQPVVTFRFLFPDESRVRHTAQASLTVTGCYTAGFLSDQVKYEVISPKPVQYFFQENNIIREGM